VKIRAEKIIPQAIPAVAALPRPASPAEKSTSNNDRINYLSKEIWNITHFL
jgi:hypothetical protein